jgi:hypothetical protein
MHSESLWAEYAHIQASARLASSITQSDANDVRLDRIVDGVINGTVKETSSIERAVRSNARKERARKLTRQLTMYAFMPRSRPNPEQALIWKQSWAHFRKTIASPEDVVLLSRSEATATSVPMTGAERTRLSRIRSSPAYKSLREELFAIQ